MTKHSSRLGILARAGILALAVTQSVKANLIPNGGWEWASHGSQTEQSAAEESLALLCRFERTARFVLRTVLAAQFTPQHG
jgi:hypothetical protein